MLVFRWLTVICLLGSLFLTGCATSSDSSSSANYTSVSVSGTITLSSGTSSRLALADTLDPENYMIWAQNRASKRVYFADLEEGGDFTLPIETSDEDASIGDSFIFCLIQKDPLTFKGTILQVGTENASTGFNITDSLDDFDINFDLSEYSGSFASDTPENVSIDDDIAVRLDDDDIPVGATNAGKGTDSQTSSLNDSNTIDRDEDGVPDIFDAMNNGADLDNTDYDNSLESTVYSDALESVVMFMNLKVDQASETSYTVTDNALLVIEVRAHSPSDIQSVEVDLLHDSFENATLDKAPDGYTVLSGSHTEDSNWFDGTSYPLYKMQNLEGDIVWTVLFKPGNNSFTPGSLVRLKVTLADSTVEYYLAAINFKFSSIPDNTTTFTSGVGSRDVPYVVPATGDVTLTWAAPQDEDGIDLDDLEYSLEFFYYDSAESQVGDRAVQDVGDDILTATIPEATLDEYQDESSPPAYIQVDITARYPYGDNSANKIYIKRSDW